MRKPQRRHEGWRLTPRPDGNSKPAFGVLPVTAGRAMAVPWRTAKKTPRSSAPFCHRSKAGDPLLIPLVVADAKALLAGLLGNVLTKARSGRRPADLLFGKPDRRKAA